MVNSVYLYFTRIFEFKFYTESRWSQNLKVVDLDSNCFKLQVNCVLSEKRLF